MISVERHALQASEARGVLRQALALPQVNGNTLTPTGLLQENGAYRLMIDSHLGVHIYHRSALDPPSCKSTCHSPFISAKRPMMFFFGFCSRKSLDIHLIASLLQAKRLTRHTSAHPQDRKDLVIPCIKPLLPARNMARCRAKRLPKRSEEFALMRLYMHRLSSRHSRQLVLPKQQGWLPCPEKFKPEPTSTKSFYKSLGSLTSQFSQSTLKSLQKGRR